MSGDNSTDAAQDLSFYALLEVPGPRAPLTLRHPSPTKETVYVVSQAGTRTRGEPLSSEIVARRPDARSASRFWRCEDFHVGSCDEWKKQETSYGGSNKTGPLLLPSIEAQGRWSVAELIWPLITGEGLDGAALVPPSRCRRQH